MQLDSALVQADRGEAERASATAFDAYMTFEKVERGVRAKNADLADALEAAFATLRTRAAGGATLPELDHAAAVLGRVRSFTDSLGVRVGAARARLLEAGRPPAPTP